MVVLDHADAGPDPLAWIVGEVELDRIRSSIQQRLFGRSGRPRPAMLGRFQVRKKLGRGGMGTVYEAFDPCLQRMVALKLVRADQRGLAAIRRMLREARALARLNHPNVVEVYDAGTCGGEFFIAMELIDGPTLRQWLGARRRTQAEVLDTFVAIGRGLAAAHEAQVVHRDFKPDNVLIGSDGRPRVVDFGVAGPMPMHAWPTTHDGSSPADGLAAASDHDSRTLSAEIDIGIDDGAAVSELAFDSSERFLGTPAYMAPEQLENLRTDARADQYAFCVALHEALLGRRPFDATTVRSLRRQLRHVRGPTIASNGIPRRLARVLTRGLSTRPADRYPSMEALLSALTAARRRRPSRVAVVTAAATVGAVLSGWLAFGLPSRGHCDDDGSDSLEAVWNPARAARLTLALTRDPNPHAIDVARRTVDAVEGWRGAWLEAHAKTCASTSPAIHRERALACLDTDRNATAEALTRLERAAAEGEPVAAAPALGHPRMCHEVGRVTADSERELHGRVVDLRRRLAAGEFEAAGHDGPDLLNGVRRSGDRSLESELAYALGEVHAMLGPVAHAESLLREAFVAATEAPRPDLAVRAGTALVRLLNAQPGRRGVAEHWRMKTAEQLESSSLPSTDPVAIDFRVAVLELASRDRALAEHEEDELSAIVQAVGELRAPLPTTLTRVATMRARVAIAAGQLITARTVLEEALERVSAALGPRHLEVASLHHQLGHVLLASGEAALAVEPLEEAATMLRHTLGARHLLTAEAYLEQAEGELVAHRLPRVRELVELARQALAPEGSPAEGGPPRLAAWIESLTGRVMQREGDDGAAIAPLRSAVELRLRGPAAERDEAALARDRLWLAQAIVRHALPRKRGRKPAEPGTPAPASELARALGLAEAAHEVLSDGDRPTDRAHADAVLGEVMLAHRDAQRAVALLRAALAYEAPDIDALMVAERRFLLARALRSSDAANGEARELAEAAAQAFRSGGRLVRAVEISAWLSEQDGDR